MNNHVMSVTMLTAVHFNSRLCCANVLLRRGVKHNFMIFMANDLVCYNHLENVVHQSISNLLTDFHSNVHVCTPTRVFDVYTVKY